MATFEIPLAGMPETFSIAMGSQQYLLRLSYQDAADGGWLLDISDADGGALVCGIPLVTGADLLSQYAYLGIDGGLYVATDGDADAVPTFDNIGVESHLYFVTA